MPHRLALTPTEAYAMIDPEQALPSGDERYVELDVVRGTHNVARHLTDLISARASFADTTTAPNYARLLLTGHRGCGKTTECNRLKDQLVAARLAVVYFEADLEFDMLKYNVNWWHILLEMVWQVDEQLSQAPYHLHIPDALKEEAMTWLARVVTKKTERHDMEASLTTEAEATVGFPLIAKLKAVVKAMVKTGSSRVTEIEQAAEQRPADLQEAVESLVSYARDTLRNKGWRGLVIIVDGLEKIPLRALGDGLTTHNSIFIHNSRRLQAPPCHLVYTMPLALLNSDHIGQMFPDTPVIMPMVHITHRNGKVDRKALTKMAELITQRIAPEVFAPGVMKTLALANGGHVRDFLRLVREAATGFGARITQADATRAIATMVDLYDRTIQEAFIAPLDHVNQYGHLPGGPYDRDLVSLLLVLEYHNHNAWVALHPCVKKAPRYERAPRAHLEEATGV